MIQADELYHAAIGRYYRFSFSLDTDENTFDIQTPDRGTRQFTGTNRDNQEHYTRIVDPVTKQPTDSPAYLDGQGGIRDSTTLKNDGPYILRYEKYPKADLNVWQFPA